MSFEWTNLILVLSKHSVRWKRFSDKWRTSKQISSKCLKINSSLFPTENNIFCDQSPAVLKHLTFAFVRLNLSNLDEFNRKFLLVCPEVSWNFSNMKLFSVQKASSFFFPLNEMKIRFMFLNAFIKKIRYSGDNIFEKKLGKFSVLRNLWKIVKQIWYKINVLSSSCWAWLKVQLFYCLLLLNVEKVNDSR